MTGNTVIDLGCGAGNDTEFLISKGFKVTAIDSQEEAKNLLEKVNKNGFIVAINDEGDL